MATRAHTEVDDLPADLRELRPFPTNKEVCRALGISESTGWRYIARGLWKAVRVGRAVRIKRSSLVEFLKLSEAT